MVLLYFNFIFIENSTINYCYFIQSIFIYAYSHIYSFYCSFFCLASLGFYLWPFSFCLKKYLCIFFSMNLLIWILLSFACLDIYFSFILEGYFHWVYIILGWQLFSSSIFNYPFSSGFHKSMKKLAISLLSLWNLLLLFFSMILRFFLFVFGFTMMNLGWNSFIYPAWVHRDPWKWGSRFFVNFEKFLAIVSSKMAPVPFSFPLSSWGSNYMYLGPSHCKLCVSYPLFCIFHTFFPLHSGYFLLLQLPVH